MTDLDKYFRANLEKYIETQRGGVVVLTTDAYDPTEKVEERIYTKSEYRSLMATGRRKLRNLNPNHTLVGGGERETGKQVGVYEIPRSKAEAQRQSREAWVQVIRG
ncbi:MAG: hypothetical protein AABX11_03300 [Nanoarchaeota archaeon]